MRPLLIMLLFAAIQASGQTADLPRYNEVYQVATHNSYWVKRAHRHELYASGTQERLLDQLHFDHVRGLEIDIHKIKHKPGQWAIYHTNRSANVFYETLPDFLRQLQQFQYSQPQHEVVTVVLELKELFTQNFDNNHTPAQLDSLLETYLGEYLFRPTQLLDRCPGKNTLCDCAQSSTEIWPATQELRGKFIFLVLGNLHFGPFGHGGMGWATYANTPHPSAFPMSSDFSEFGTKKGWKEYVPPAMLLKAYQASVFQQVEKTYAPEHLITVTKFIKAGGIVRGGSSFSLAEQRQRIHAGFHLLQTDYPWIQLSDHGYQQPFRAIDSARFTDPTVFIEPGRRIFISPDSAITAWRTVSTADTLNDWETLPSSTRSSPIKKFFNHSKTNGAGCLVAAADAQNYVSLCRKVNEWQNAVITVTIVNNGLATKKRFVTANRLSGLVGDYIRMKIEQPSGNSAAGSNVSFFSSSEMMQAGNHQLTPKWNLIYTLHLNSRLAKQGLAASQGDVLFSGTKLNGLEVGEDMFTKDN